MAAATPAMLRIILPTLDLEDNVTPKNIVAESPQEFRILYLLLLRPSFLGMFVFVCNYSSALLVKLKIMTLLEMFMSLTPISLVFANILYIR
jgi:hypothetical protein